MDLTTADRAVRLHAEAAWPLECCGLVVATAAHHVEVRRSANLAAHPAASFVLDPSVLLAARRAGERPLAIYHSHPDQPADLSDRDRAAFEAQGRPLWPGVEIWVLACYRGLADPPRRYRWSSRAARYVCVETHHLRE